MLIAGILLGLLLGLRAGGRLDNLANIQLRWPLLLVAAVIVRFGTEVLLNLEVGLVEDLRAPLLALGFGLLLIALWANRLYPGLVMAFVGIALNGLVILINGGYMPIWATSLEAAGLTPDDVTSALHVVVEGQASDFLLRALVLGDIIPIPLPIIQNVASLGDLFLTAGLAFFLFASVVRVPTKLEEHEEAVVYARLAGLAASARLPRPDAGRGVAAETGLAPALRDSAALERPRLLGRPEPGPRVAGTALPCRSRPPSWTSTLRGPAITLPRPSQEALERVRRHPYVRLGLNGSFTSLWAGQLISLFGDRIHQLALAAAVLITTGSALATALVFVAATIPNLLFSPIAGTLVDRWDHKEVLVVSDLLRAAVVLLIPIAIVTNILLVYPLVFAADLDLDLLPAGASRDPAPDRAAGRATDGELGAVGRRDAGRRHRLPAGRALRSRPRGRRCRSRSGSMPRPTRRRPSCSARSSCACPIKGARRSTPGSASRPPLPREPVKSFLPCPSSLMWPPASSASSRRAGASCGASPSSWPTRSRHRSRS